VTDLPPQEVDGFGVSAVSIEDENGNPARPAIELTWNGDQEDVRGLEYEVEAADGTSIVKGSTLSVESGVFVVAEGILPGKGYRVRARFIVFRPTVWTPYAPVTTLDLRIRPEDLDAPAFQVNGMAIFGGTLQSDNFVTGVSGWQMNRDGSMELQDLVARDWIQVGAVTDFSEVVLPAETHVYGGYANFYFGPSPAGQITHCNCSFQIRRAGLDNYTVNTGGGPEPRVRIVGSQASVQTRVQNNGVWSGFSTRLTSPDATGGWFGQSTIFHLLGPFDSAHLRILVLYTGSGASGIDVFENNIRLVSAGAQVTAR
ncbi:MAG: hypothetical protein AAF317_13825, partial [Pseudomonadota bacterium]